MPEASFLCIDSTEYMRNGDYFPNRLMAVQEAANLLCNAKMQQNQENTLGFLTFGGHACSVVETLTADVDRVVASLTQIPLAGKVPHFSRALQIASLALTHRINSRAEKRIIAFVGSPLVEADDEMTKLAKKLRKDNYAVDVVALGVEANVTILKDFVEKVNKDGNSRLLVVPDGVSVTDCLMSSAIFLGNDAVAEGAGNAPATSAGFEFGVDPSVDPELAMVLRMSMEEERRRQEAQSQQAAAAVAQTGGAAPAVDVPAAPPVPPAASSARELTEEEELELALKLSQEEATATAGSEAAPGAIAPEAQQALDDEAFMAQLRSSLEQQQQQGSQAPDGAAPKKPDAQ